MNITKKNFDKVDKFTNMQLVSFLIYMSIFCSGMFLGGRIDFPSYFYAIGLFILVIMANGEIKNAGFISATIAMILGKTYDKLYKQRFSQGHNEFDVIFSSYKDFIDFTRNHPEYSTTGEIRNIAVKKNDFLIENILPIIRENGGYAIITETK